MSEEQNNNELLTEQPEENTDKQVISEQERINALSQMLAAMPEDQRNQLMMNLMQGQMPGMPTTQLSEKDKLKQKLKNKIQQCGFSRMGKKQQSQIKQKYTDAMQKKMEKPKPEEKNIIDAEHTNDHEHDHEHCHDQEHHHTEHQQEHNQDSNNSQNPIETPK